MSESQIEWWTLEREHIFDLMRTHQNLTILAIRGDGLGYFGEVNRIEREFVELRNGDMLQNLYFNGPPVRFAIIERPKPKSFKLGDRRLI